MANDADLLIIGSGIYGIAALRTYLSLHPTHKVVMLEADSCPGGVWSTKRVYDAFWTQSPLGIFEFSDEPLKDVQTKDTYYLYFQARHFTKYLDEYLESHVYAGKTLKVRIELNSRVQKLWKETGEWHAQTTSNLYTAPKVIDASGQTSIPNTPNIPGADLFSGILIHHKDFGRTDISQKCRCCVVLGGGKSAADVAYGLAKAGLKVHWVIRKTGNGPAAFLPPESPISYYKNSNASFHTRFMSHLTASIYTPSTILTRLLHHTAIGRAILHLFWSRLQKKLSAAANYDREDGQANGFSNLRPDTKLFWQNDSSGINQRPDFFDTIAHKVQVYRQDIVSISTHAIHFANGTSIETDSIVYATGWSASTPYLSPESAYALGLSTDLTAETPSQAQKWHILEKSADASILTQFPILARPPPAYKPEQEQSPFRLYKAMIPIYDHSIAFLGKMAMSNHTYNAEVQALFAVAVLDGNAQLPSEAEMEKEVALVRAWQRRRYPAKGEAGNWFYFDIVPYTDALLEQLGLSSHRTTGVRDLLRPTEARHLRGLLNEYISKTSGAETNDTS
ncbi:FAD/NAD(P)-binding domain-containing protein [Lojkania enalia]|uniref:FAD/NAD(P)-binding domain-containing protein n=1 Tax=Lojkania enalia TaxID=147567 RepID=A0A9P4KC26_9PLEO|nr:FAD/NAD(P)-binding domain-containing protein [Didymosphaeria enalia]